MRSWVCAEAVAARRQRARVKAARRSMGVMAPSFARRVPVGHLSARVIAGGRGRGPSRSDGRVRWAGGLPLSPHIVSCNADHLTYPLLRNGALPLPRFAAERTKK